uniref:uncharacterized protein LOC122604753 n=1 Tax=Erigeron canadensis TaxID=72917 RepID=UPI001CB9ADC4|nr:uncharacterized protein LOC122604753 [Erigeron canadensis]
MVLVDEQGTRIQATVKRNLIGQFDALLQEGGVRVLSKFGVAENSGRLLLTRHPCKLNFYRHTTVRMSNDWTGPAQSFQLRSFNDILARDSEAAYSFACLPYVGLTHSLFPTRGTKLMGALWDEHANKLDAFLADPHRSDTRVIMLLQFAKLGEWANEPQISNSMFGSKILINEDLPTFAEFKDRLMNVHVDPTAERLLSSATVFSNPVEYWSRFEHKDIDELMDITENPERKRLVLLLAPNALKRLSVFTNWWMRILMMRVLRALNVV